MCIRVHVCLYVRMYILVHECVGVYTCVHVCISVHECVCIMCMCMCRYLCACVGQSTYKCHFSLLSTFIFWGRVSCWTWSLLIWLGWLASVFKDLPASAHTPPLPPVLGHRCALPYLPFTCTLGSRLRSSCFGGRHLLSFLPGTDDYHI